ncbi:S8 family peptidase [Actinoplanes sp. NPDC051513]|uniref:S8 family peptidase n=1 Tax=Actinoplanes sp. NPDC051513 TaxID=3363908 RepID=UPI0037ADDC1C
MRIIDSEVTPKLHTDRTLLFASKPVGHLVGSSSSKPVGHFADVLAGVGMPGVLGTPEPLCDGIDVVPLTGDAIADDVLSALDGEGEGGQLVADPAFYDGTFKLAASKPVGHGLAFVEVTLDQEPPSAWKPPAPTLRRPVIALLDTGVRYHRWLSVGTDEDPFLIDATRQAGHEWQPLDTMPSEDTIVAHLDSGSPSKAGHATFIAGLIRQAAPGARVLDVRVLNDKGFSNESTVCRALKWILEHIERGNPVDVICMAFGRIPGDEGPEPLVQPMRCLLGKLADKGVQLVASAGNDHFDGDVYPGAFETVTAVGAGFAGYHADFSNFGDWVGRYRDGVDLLSTFPDGKWARWSGTSFAAASFAADLARPHVVAVS